MKSSDHTDGLSVTSPKGVYPPCHDPQHNTATPPVLVLFGGDARQLSTASVLSEAGYEVRLMGLGEAEDGGLSPRSPYPLPRGVKICQRTDRALEGCAGIILPYPATKDGETIFCPLDIRTAVSLSEIAAYGQKHPEVKIFGGRMPKSFVAGLRGHGCTVTEFEDSEAFLIRNARLTAEGAVMTAMNLTDTALLHAPVAVIGYGRIGKILAGLLAALGADVTVFARREESLAEAEAAGHRAVSTTRVQALCEGYGVIFNTVPARLLDKGLMLSLPCRTKIIELASAPGCLDPEGVTEATRRCGLQVIRAPSLPGRYAPVDAGCAIAECILSALGEVTV